MSLDLVIKNGTIVTAESTYQADIGIQSLASQDLGRHGAGHLGCIDDQYDRST